MFNNHARGQAVASGLMLKHILGFELRREMPSSLVEAYPELQALAPTLN
jgi:hypothetical protein